jgi:hypothetical protein
MQGKSSGVEHFSEAGVDIIACDADGQPSLLVEVKGQLTQEKYIPQILAQLSRYLKSTKPFVPFVMLVDPGTISVFRWNGSSLDETSSNFKTADILDHYDAKFQEKRIFEFYLTTLVEAWLRDLAFHWKLEVPPATEELRAIGLLPLLEGGTTESEV